ALRQRREGAAPFFAANMNNTRSPEFLPVHAVADRLDGDDIEDLLTDGCTPIATDDVGAELVKYVTTRSKDPGGTVDDQRAADVHRVSVVHAFVDRLVAKIALQYPDFF